jgi:hypothetical protein
MVKYISFIIIVSGTILIAIIDLCNILLIFFRLMLYFYYLLVAFALYFTLDYLPIQPLPITLPAEREALHWGQ